MQEEEVAELQGRGKWQQRRGGRGWREERRTSEAAADAFGSVYLFFPVSPVASLAAGVRADGFAACAPCSSCVCECVCRGRTSSPPIYLPASRLPSHRKRGEQTKAPAPANRFLPFPGRFVPVLMMPATITMTAMIAGPL